MLPYTALHELGGNMAKKVVLIDDVTGDVIDEGLGKTIEFSFDGTHYTIDLSVQSADQFKSDLSKWIKAAAEVEAPRRATTTARRRGAPPGGSGRSKEELANVREWLNKHGHEVSSRGRIPQNLLDEYDKAHTSKPGA
jgi:hypothetical protein